MPKRLLNISAIASGGRITRVADDMCRHGLLPFRCLRLKRRVLRRGEGHGTVATAATASTSISLDRSMMMTPMAAVAILGALGMLEVGTRVEVDGNGIDAEGFKGARFAGEVVGVEPDRAGVRIDSWSAVEWVEWKYVSSEPALPEGHAWIGQTKAGDHVDMLYDGGWWNMRVMDVKQGCLSLCSVTYGCCHQVTDMSQVRPASGSMSDSMCPPCGSTHEAGMDAVGFVWLPDAAGDLSALPAQLAGW